MKSLFFCGNNWLWLLNIWLPVSNSFKNYWVARTNSQIKLLHKLSNIISLIVLHRKLGNTHSIKLHKLLFNFTEKTKQSQHLLCYHKLRIILIHTPVAKVYYVHYNFNMWTVKGRFCYFLLPKLQKNDYTRTVHRLDSKSSIHCGL